MAFEHTENFKEYQKYKQFKEDNSFYYKHINLVEVCSIDFIDIIAMKAERSFRAIVVSLFRRLNIKTLKRAFMQYDIVCTYDVPGRKDHQALAASLHHSIDNSISIPLSYSYKCYFNPIAYLKCFFWIRKKLKCTLNNTCFLAAKFVFCVRTINSLNRSFNRYQLTDKKFLPFCSTIYTENLLVHFFKQKGVTTYHTFHGFFGRYINFIPNDIINGENLVTDYILSFSEGQKKDLITDFGIDKNRILVAGQPKYPSKSIFVNNSMQNCLILGSIWFYDEYLAILLSQINDLATKTGISFSLKPHPSSHIYNHPSVKKYTIITFVDQKLTLQELLQNNQYDFAITFNTSAYYECMYYGVIPLRWSKFENVDFEGLDDKFEDVDALLKKIMKYRHTNPEQIRIQFERVLIQNMGMGINNYNTIINDN